MGLNDLLFLCRHLLVPILFHAATSLNPPSFQRNYFSACLTHSSYLEHSNQLLEDGGS